MSHLSKLTKSIEMLVANLDKEMESEKDILIGVAILVGRNEK